MSVMKKDAREEGVKEGLVGQIRVFQRLLKQSPTSTDQLSQMSLDDLRRLADDLERQLLPASS